MTQPEAELLTEAERILRGLALRKSLPRSVHSDLDRALHLIWKAVAWADDEPGWRHGSGDDD